jgi:hypothetical protein
MKQHYPSDNKNGLFQAEKALFATSKYSQNNSFWRLLYLFIALFGFTQGYSQITLRGVSPIPATPSTGNTITIAKPTGVVLGDIMIVNIGSSTVSFSAFPPAPAGWTLIDARSLGGGGNTRYGALLYKIATGGEPSSYTFNLDPLSFDTIGAIVAFSGVNTVTPFDVLTGTINLTNTNTVTALTKTTVTANAAVIMFGMAANSIPTFSGWNTTSPGPLTELYDYQNFLSTVGAAWAIKPVAGATGNGTATLSGSQRNGGILIALRPTTAPPPTITSISSLTGCAGIPLTITGTNLGTTSAVSIGGTAVAAITAISATSVTVTTGPGTTGTVIVTTAGGIATSASTYTFTGPANPANPTSNSPQCNPTGVTITQTGSAPVGQTWYWQTVTGGTSTANDAATPLVVNTSGTYYIRSFDGTCWSTGQGSVAVVVNNPISTLASTPVPADSSIENCYTGTGIVTQLSWAAAAGANSYDVYFGAGSLPGAITANVVATNYATGALLPSTTYYWKIVPRNSTCGASTGAVVTWNFTTSSLPCYCTSSGSTSPTGITGVTFNTINNLNNGVTLSYSDFTPINTTVSKGVNYNLIVRVNTNGNFTNHQTAWIDWNGDGDFVDAGEQFALGTVTNVTNGITSLSPLSVTVPVGAITGTVRMRIQSRTGSTTGNSCLTGFTGEVEDYTLNIINPVPCTTPTAQPTALSLSATGTFISGSFTPAVPAPNNYLVIYNATGITPNPINGMTYLVGSVLGGGSIVTSIDNSTTFNITGLANTVTYYIYIFSYNSFCTGGPLYNTTSPLNGFITTNTLNYCTPSVSPGLQSVHYIKDVDFVGTLNDVSNSSTFSSNPIGFQDFTSLPKAIQAQGQGVNIFVQARYSSYIKAWVDWNNDGDFIDVGEQVYSSGNVSLASTTFGFIIPTAQALGDYRVRIRINGKDSTGMNPNSTPAYTSCLNIDYGGETEDYLFTVIANCNAFITSVTNGDRCDTGTVNLVATGSAGVTGYNWYTTPTGGIAVNSPTPTASTWTTPSISTTTTYYVVAVNGCESIIRTPVVAKIKPISNVAFTPVSPEVCGENAIIAITATGDIEEAELIDEKFNSGLGVFTNTNYINNGAAINAKTAWQNRTSTFVPAELSWYPAISSGANLNNFVMSTSDVGSVTSENALVSPVVNSNNFSDLTLTFNIYYSRYYPDFTFLTRDYVTLNVSTDGGTTWQPDVVRYLSDQGIGTQFVSKTFNLNAYINQPNLRLRIFYHGEFCDGVAIDDFRLFGNKPVTPSFAWSNPIPVVPLTGFAFTDPACTIPYVAGTTISTVYIKPTSAQLVGSSFSFDSTVTLSNGCPVAQTVVIQNKSKTWLGTTSNWNLASNWQPAGVPNITNCVIIPNVSNLNAGAPGLGKNLLVKNGGTLEVQGGNSLTIKEAITVESTGVFNIKNNSSLVQIDNTINTGNINMERITNVRRQDYVYWSTPVASFNSGAIVPSPLTAGGYIFKWIPTILANTNGWGNWTAGTEAMVLGKGYIVRGPTTFTTTAAPYTANFIGIPNNGDISIGIQRGNYTGVPYNTGVSATLANSDDDNWNLIGNPYPSAINPTSFLAGNTNVAGFVKVWKHGIPISATASPFYNTYTYNYSPSDYVIYNGAGSTVGPGVDNIAAGQGFVVLMNDLPTTASENVTFRNTMRRDAVSGNAYSNNQFYKNGQRVDSEKNRIWLDLITPNNLNVRALLGYIEGASNERDRLFDAPVSDALDFNLYTMVNDVPLCIQGKSLPFNNEDTVKIGYKASVNGSHSIAIAYADGLFSNNQDIFLEDKLLNITHNLKLSLYSFTTNSGVYNDRFVLHYIDKNTLGNTNFDYSNQVTVFSKNNITVTSTTISIKQVIVSDIVGKTLINTNNIGKNEIQLNDLRPTNTVLIVKVILDNGAESVKKIVF